MNIKEQIKKSEPDYIIFIYYISNELPRYSAETPKDYNIPEEKEEKKVKVLVIKLTEKGNFDYRSNVFCSNEFEDIKHDQFNSGQGVQMKSPISSSKNKDIFNKMSKKDVKKLAEILKNVNYLLKKETDEYDEVLQILNSYLIL
jgi:hypothetical protein